MCLLWFLIYMCYWYGFFLYFFSNIFNRGYNSILRAQIAIKMSTTSQQGTATVTATVPPSTTNAKTNSGDEKLASLSSKRDASWPSVLFYIHLNILGLYGIMVLFTNAYLTTVIFTAFLSFIGIIGVTCGAHRLWAHQTYEANTFLKLFLMLCQTMAGQVNKLIWNNRK